MNVNQSEKTLFNNIEFNNDKSWQEMEKWKIYYLVGEAFWHKEGAGLTFGIRYFKGTMGSI